MNKMKTRNITELFRLDGEDFIFSAYRTILGREPDRQGMNYYLGRLAIGHGKASVISQLAHSPEAHDIDKIIGLKQLLANEKRSKRWLFGINKIFLNKQGTLNQISASLSQINRNFEFLIKNFSTENKQVQKNKLEYFGTTITDEIDNRILQRDDYLLQDGTDIIFAKTIDANAFAEPDGFLAWIKAQEPTDAHLQEQREFSDSYYPLHPLFSVILPIYKIDINILRSTIASVIRQTWKNWELCIAYADVDNHETLRYLRKIANVDSRVRLKLLINNGGISRNSNSALEIARGEYIALLDHDDELTPWALFDMAAKIFEKPHTDFLYSDKDSIDAKGTIRKNPLFKPAWSPEMLYSVNYLTHFNVLRRQLVLDVGGWNPVTDGAQDWDLFLRVAEKSRCIERVPSIHYHWRIIPGSTSTGLAAKPYAAHGQLRALADRLQRLELPATVVPNADSGFHVVWNHNLLAKVDVIIHGYTGTEDLSALILAVTAQTDGFLASVTVVLPIDFESTLFPDRLPRQVPLYFVNFSGNNLTAGISQAVTKGSADVVMLIDVKVIAFSRNALYELYSWVSNHPDIGFASALHLLSDETVAECGRIVGKDYLSHPFFYGTPLRNWGLLGGALWYRNISAASAMTFAVKRPHFTIDKFLSLHWEQAITACCSAIIKHGLRGLINPHSRAYLKEMPDLDCKWDESFRTDPYFHPAFCSITPLALDSDGAASKETLHIINKKRVAQPTKNHLNEYTRDALSLAQFVDCDYAAFKQKQQNPEIINSIRSERTCNWYLPVFENPFYGGIMTILRLASFLKTADGVRQRFLICGDCDSAKISERITQAFPSLKDSEVIALNSPRSINEIPSSDYSVATLWTTAYVLLKVTNTGYKYYLIQDFEPLFYPAGSTYAQAELTYRFKFLGIANTQSLKEIYETKYNGLSTVLKPNVDTSIFYPHSGLPKDGKFRLFYYARPGIPRNNFEIAVTALKLVKSRFQHDLEIICAGQNWDPADYGLERVVETIGMLPYHETGDLYRTCHVGLSMMMTPHPSYLPFEMMACGTLVVTNYNPANEWLLKDRVTCLVSEPSASCLAETLIDALENYDYYAYIREAATRKILTSHGDWDKSLRQVADFMHQPGL